MVSPFIQGMGMGGGLIVAIGAQNAFVLTQAVRRNHTLAITLVCCLCDMIFISLGVTGVGAAVAANPTLTSLAAWGGGLFLLWYGWGAFRSALRGGTLEARGDGAGSLRATLIALLAVTLLNPHFYLDTVVLLGSVSGQFSQDARTLFGAGAITASIIWFSGLSLGGRMLAPVFARPMAWRVLDGLVCLVMWSLAVSLIRPQLVA
ncbi:LysE/ArgO family amino acid transporter [Desulfovibrio ferrophilus]|uniref:Lysine exporter protein LysE/YggA n=1 Tax=Desulfovibrio ferrophilus TaxID=241368 RepID=A0A2Z6B190_9BACT|nr:LysE/ArgO family amino acid transporter [Desulfovibrio ferrophilus]BBD09223.1 lysine exporter protein LysE/YggA [Desulfovibrio ferrophilus]